MEALREALLCPVCLELFTPPVLVLSCAHNFCKQCLEKILIHQNCHHVNGHFHCPLCRKESEKLINELTADATDTKVMIDTVGTGLLKGILYRTAELHSKLHNDYSTKLETLQVISKEAEAPRQLYHQMETLLEQHVNSVQFLQEDKKLKEKIEKMLEGKASYQDPPTYKISVKQYFEELIKGINIKDYLSSACQEMLTSTTDIAETCRSEYPAFVFSGQSPDQSFYKQVLQLFEKSNDVNQDILKM
ncbi:tripartite motif containing 13-like isoform X3 [Cygnus olor]|uniref:tripartite motif containing 13-like isoform X3 n=1 Tax=Cygnus olor TaxID=8869 RepID=UPI001ADE8185|nr:tripartite motif containing 13-like isoform X3 [Cygnus olor]